MTTNQPTPVILSESEIGEIEAMFPHANYQPTLSPDEVDPCKFCNGTIDDHKANCVVPYVHALIQTVRALRGQYESAVSDFAIEINALREQLARAQEKDASRCDDIGILQSRLAQVEKERDGLRGELERKNYMSMFSDTHVGED